MLHLNRREFMKTSAGAIAAGLVSATAGAALAEAAKDAPCAAAARRVLGKSGIETSVLGVGTGTRAWNRNSAQIRTGDDNFVRILIRGYEHGLSYFDLADMYGSHEYLRDAMREASIPREDLMILTKSTAKEPGALQKDLDRFRKEADTDYFDIVLLHCMTDPEWVTNMAGCMDVLSEAKEKGIIRAHGVSCHNFGAMQSAVASDWVDVMLSRINPFGEKMDASVEEVVQLLRDAHARGIGNLGMKIAGEGTHADQIAESIRFVLGLGCVETMTIGFLKTEELDATVAHVENAVASLAA